MQKEVILLKKQTLVFITFLVLTISGCSTEPQTSEQIEESNGKTQTLEQSSSVETEEMAEIYHDIYKEAEEKNTIGDLEMVQEIVHRLGENGYIAVDRENQINMTCAEQVVQFCKKVEEEKEAKITIISVNNNGGFTKYDLITNKGNVDIEEEYYAYENSHLEKEGMKSYSAYAWRYTEEGYLFFEEYHMKGYDGPSGHTALRVQPLDETCRELNRKYMLPVGYEQNDIFLLDWDESDFGEIDFYDVFDKFYTEVYGQFSPYVEDENFNVGAIYRIPKDEFETVIKSHFNIDDETLQSKTTYFSEDESYEYRPRGWYASESPSHPYPEVVAYKENDDGTITLTVNVVYPDNNTSKVYAHEVVIRPLSEEGFQYVSNHIIPAEDNCEPSWHTDRLTEEQWEEIYGEKKK